MRWLDETPEARVGVISGAGKHFTAGIDLDMLAGMKAQIRDDCDGRSREKLRRVILDMQDTLSSIERCRKPVIAAIHGACVGGGIDLICACDLRYCSADAFFSVKEIDVGLTADVGTLQRLPRLIGEGAARELAYTGRKVGGAEAKELRLVNQCYPDREALMAAMRELAAYARGKAAARLARLQGNDHLCARPHRRRRPELRRHLERRDAPVHRPRRSARRGPGETRGEIPRLIRAAPSGF